MIKKCCSPLKYKILIKNWGVKLYTTISDEGAEDNEVTSVTPLPNVTEKADNEDTSVTPVPDVTEKAEHQEEYIEGNIVSINEDGIVINLIDSWEDENGAMSVSTGILLDVTFEEDTVFTVMTIRNMGADYDIRPGSRSDLGERLIVKLKGYKDGEGFICYEAEIVNIIY